MQIVFLLAAAILMLALLHHKLLTVLMPTAPWNASKEPWIAGQEAVLVLMGNVGLLGSKAFISGETDSKSIR